MEEFLSRRGTQLLLLPITWICVYPDHCFFVSCFFFLILCFRFLFVVFFCLMGLYRVFSFFLGFMWVLGRILAPLMLINGDTTISLHRYIPHWWYTLSAGDERYTHVWCDKSFSRSLSSFPHALFLLSPPRCNAFSSSSHASL